MTSLFVTGATGRMGLEVLKQAGQRSNYQVLGGTSRSKPQEPNETPQLLIDFSLPENFDHVVEFVEKHRCALVCGTTGLQSEHFTRLEKLGEKSPIFWSANMSFGVYLMCQLTETLARFHEFYNFHVEETHHIHKKDKPSGTALIIEAAAKKSTNKLGETVAYREGEVFGIHRFIATSQREQLEIRHEALDRGLFAQGALDIGLWLVTQKPGYYKMDDFFAQFQRSPSASRQMN